MSKAMPAELLGPPGFHLDRKLKLFMGLAGLLLALAVSVVLITDGMYNPRLFNIRKIALSGDAAHVDRESLRGAVARMIDGNYFSLDSGKIIKALHTLPWVETVRLRRRWPDTLMIEIEEYQPIALWGDDKWLTTSGKLVSLPLPSNVVLPSLSGPAGQSKQVWDKYQAWAALFARNGLRLRDLELSPQHIYTLNIEYSARSESQARGLTMIVSESNSDSQLEAFLESRRLALVENPGRIKRVDLRYPSGFSVSFYEPDELAQSDK